jgi:hypothetical protein
MGQVSAFLHTMAGIVVKMLRYVVLLFICAFTLFVLVGVPPLAAATLGLCLDCCMVAFSAAGIQG